jgi:hypothetical protein
MQLTCKHIKSSGARCRAVALSGHPFCFWHNRIYRTHVEANRWFPVAYNPENSAELREENPTLDRNFTGLRANFPDSDVLPPLEDAESIQISISLILRALADSRIQHKQAALMLYALQIAANNVRAVKPAVEDSVPHIARTQEGFEIAGDSVAFEVSEAPAIPELHVIPETAAQPTSDIPSKLLLTEVQSQPMAEAA